MKSFNSFSRSCFYPEIVYYLVVQILLRNFFAKLAFLKFFFETVVVRKTIPNLSSSLLKFRVNNMAKVWFVLLNFNNLQI